MLDSMADRGGKVHSDVDSRTTYSSIDDRSSVGESDFQSDISECTVATLFGSDDWFNETGPASGLASSAADQLLSEMRQRVYGGLARQAEGHQDNNFSDISLMSFTMNQPANRVHPGSSLSVDRVVARRSDLSFQSASNPVTGATFQFQGDSNTLTSSREEPIGASQRLEPIAGHQHPIFVKAGSRMTQKQLDKGISSV